MPIFTQFEIRLCPALQKKPTLPTIDTPEEHSNQNLAGDAKPDPFAPPYNPNLFVGELKDEDSEAEYAVLVRLPVKLAFRAVDAHPLLQLNKYSVVPHHFLLVTKGTA
jgi:sulfate adenylyltransferase (ADP) / ATP adenylyltransferase